MNKTLAFSVLAFLLAGMGCQKRSVPSQQDEMQGTLSISGAFALYPMAVKWAEEFRKIHPGVNIDVSAGGAGKGMADVLNGMVDIGMVSREIQAVEIAKGAWWAAVAKDGVVAVVNEKNPVGSILRRTGVRKEQFQEIWLQGGTRNWEDIAGQRKIVAQSAVHVYTRSDSCGAAETWALFLGGKQDDLKGIGVYGDPGLAEAVKKDTLGIGYNNINFAYDPTTLRPITGLMVLAIDLNGNGNLEAEESFYDNRDMLIRAVSEGRYPSPPARDLYFVFKGKPQHSLLKAFLLWVLGAGQKFLPESGYVSPATEKTSAALDQIKE